MDGFVCLVTACASLNKYAKLCLSADLSKFRVLTLLLMQAQHLYGLYSECIPSAEPLSVKHILRDCVDFVPMRQRYSTVTSMRDLFDRILYA